MAGGYKGLVDFVGFSVGQPPPPPPAGGYKGLVDFVGFSVGQGGGELPTVVPKLPLLGVG